MFAKECVVERRPSRKDVSGRHHQSRAELGPMPMWVVRMVTGVVLGSTRAAEGWPLFDVLAEVESGAWVDARVDASPKIQHHCEVLAFWLRTSCVLD